MWDIQRSKWMKIFLISDRFISLIVRYCDVLHKAALHLGRWNKVEGRNNHLPTQTWNDSVLWPHGSLVKHNKELYRSEGLCTAAEPGNSSHYRFHVSKYMVLCFYFILSKHECRSSRRSNDKDFDWLIALRENLFEKFYSVHCCRYTLEVGS